MRTNLLHRVVPLGHQLVAVLCWAMDTDVKLLGVLDGTLEWRGNNPRHKWRLLLTQSPQHMVHPLDIHCLLAHNPLRHCLLVFFSVCLRACEQSEKKRCKFGNVADVIVRFSSHGRVHSERNQKEQRDNKQRDGSTTKQRPTNNKKEKPLNQAASAANHW